MPFANIMNKFSSLLYGSQQQSHKWMKRFHKAKYNFFFHCGSKHCHVRLKNTTFGLEGEFVKLYIDLKCKIKDLWDHTEPTTFETKFKTNKVTLQSFYCSKLGSLQIQTLYEIKLSLLWPQNLVGIYINIFCENKKLLW